MGLNLGTGTPEKAAALVEYCNVEKGTKWSDLRRSHGIESPTKLSTGAWATKWTVPGRSDT